MKREIDARGENCPKPFIMTKKALDDGDMGTIVTIVDNEVAKENVCKLVDSLNLKYKVEQDHEDFYIEIEKTEVGNCSEKDNTSSETNFKDRVVVFTKDKLGHGNDELGKILIKGYIYTLTELEEKPKRLIFLNGGVLLTTGESETISDLKKLEDMGVEIYSCGTCLDYYHVKDDLKVGEIANMYIIANAMNEAENTITL